MHHGNVSLPVSADPAFPDFYRTRLAPLEDSTDDHRRHALAETTRRLISSAAALVITAGLAALAVAPGMDELWFFFFVVWSAVAVVLGAWAWWPRLGQASQQKEDLVSRLIPFYGDLRFDPHPNVDVHRYRAWHVLPRFDSRQARDRIHGSRRRIPFSAAEITLSRRVRSTRDDSSTRSVQVFEGLLVEIRLPARCRGTTVLGGSGMVTDDFEAEVRDLENLGDRHPGFEVYTDDPEAAEELVTSDLLRGLDRVRQELEADRLVGGFHKRHLILLVERAAVRYEPSRNDLDLRAHAEEVRSKLAPILAIFDHLPLEPVLEEGETATGSDETPDQGSPAAYQAPGRYAGWGCFFAVLGWAAAFVASGWIARRFLEGPSIPAAACVGSLVAVVVGLTVYRLVTR